MLDSDDSKDENIQSINSPKLRHQELAQTIDEFSKAQRALIARLEVKIDNLETMLGSMVLGYAELTAMVDTLVHDRLQHLETDDAQRFMNELDRNKRKVIEALQSGHDDAKTSTSQPA